MLGGNLLLEWIVFLVLTTIGRFLSSKSNGRSSPQNLGWSLQITLWRNQSKVNFSSSSVPLKTKTSSLTPRGGNVNDSLSDCPVTTVKGPNPNPIWEITFKQPVGSDFAWNFPVSHSDYLMYCITEFTSWRWESNLDINCLVRYRCAPLGKPIFFLFFYLLNEVLVYLKKHQSKADDGFQNCALWSL